MVQDRAIGTMYIYRVVFFLLLRSHHHAAMISQILLNYQSTTLKIIVVQFSTHAILLLQKLFNRSDGSS